MKIGIGADHAGYEDKERVKKTLDDLGIQYEDFGTVSTNPSPTSRSKCSVLFRTRSTYDFCFGASVPASPEATLPIKLRRESI